ncbi:MAG: ShlB/FhaC/HecB family hemolysin secretion/activation protein [Rhizomicrobium sp.]
MTTGSILRERTLGRRLGLALAILGAASLISMHASASPPVDLPGAVQPGHDRPIPQPEATPDFDFSVEAPHRSPVPRAVDEIHFKLADIRVVGATTLSPDRFRPLYQGLIGQDVSLANIYDVADAIEKEYRAAGYLLVRAYVPPQHVKDGIFTIRVVEGFVESTSVEGGSPAVRSQVKAYLAPLLREHPPRLKTIERALLLSNDIPGVAATGVLRASPSVPGASDLIVTLTAPSVTGGLSSTNRGSHFSGIWTVTGTAAYAGIFGADELDATVTTTPGDLKQQDSGQLRYRTEIGDDGLMGTLLGAITHGVPGGSLGAADILTNSWAVGPRLTYPLIRTREDTVTLDGGFTVQDAKVDILGVGISHDQWRVLDVSVSYASNDFLAGVFTSAFDVAQGLPILGASPDHSPELSLDGRSDFTKATALLHYTNTLAAPFSFAIAGTGQYSFEPLITGEQILFGGTQIGRGYDPGAITGDSGAGGSFEVRYDTRLTDLWIQNLQPYAFFDSAKVWNMARPPAAGIPLGNYAIASTGGGLRFWFPYNIYLDLEGARTLRAVPGSDGDKEATKFLVDVAITF